jgi:hypothetical protein
MRKQKACRKIQFAHRHNLNRFLLDKTDNKRPLHSTPLINSLADDKLMNVGYAQIEDTLTFRFIDSFLTECNKFN